MLCLGMRISFENILNLVFGKYTISNLDLNQIHNCYKNGLKWVVILKFHVMFGNNNFIWKFGIVSNLLFGKLIIFKFGFESNSIIIFKVVKVKNLRMTTQTLSFSNSSFIIS